MHLFFALMITLPLPGRTALDRWQAFNEQAHSAELQQQMLVRQQQRQDCELEKSATRELIEALRVRLRDLESGISNIAHQKAVKRAFVRYRAANR